MKKIEAIISRSSWTRCARACPRWGITGLTVTEVRVSAARRATPSSIAVLNTWSTSCPRSRSRSCSPMTSSTRRWRRSLKAAHGQDRRRQDLHHAGGAGHPHPHWRDQRSGDLIFGRRHSGG